MPRMQGRPPITNGSCVILDKRLLAMQLSLPHFVCLVPTYLCHLTPG